MQTKFKTSQVMKQEIINEQIQDMLNMLDETGEFPQWRLENLSKDPEALFKACLEWEGIIGFEYQITQWAKGMFKANPQLLWDESDENPFELLKKNEEEISFLVDLLSEEQLDRFIQFTIDREEMNNEKG